MIKLVAAELVSDHEIRLRFSDDSSGTLDFRPFLDANTEMTAPLRDPGFFRRFFIELGALAWPNGFDLSAESLRRRLDQGGRLGGSSATV
jgi:hypothetical protein